MIATTSNIEQIAHEMSTDFYGGSSDVSLAEINGFEIGMLAFLICDDKGRLPAIIKNYKVEAMKSFERTQSLYPEVEIPQEFYIGYLKGFCEIGSRYGF